MNDTYLSTSFNTKSLSCFFRYQRSGEDRDFHKARENHLLVLSEAILPSKRRDHLRCLAELYRRRWELKRGRDDMTQTILYYQQAVKTVNLEDKPEDKLLVIHQLEHATAVFRFHSESPNVVSSTQLEAAQRDLEALGRSSTLLSEINSSFSDWFDILVLNPSHTSVSSPQGNLFLAPFRPLFLLRTPTANSYSLYSIGLVPHRLVGDRVLQIMNMREAHQCLVWFQLSCLSRAPMKHPAHASTLDFTIARTSGSDFRLDGELLSETCPIPQTSRRTPFKFFGLPTHPFDPGFSHFQIAQNGPVVVLLSCHRKCMAYIILQGEPEVVVLDLPIIPETLTNLQRSQRVPVGTSTSTTQPSSESQQSRAGRQRYG